MDWERWVLRSDVHGDHLAFRTTAWNDKEMIEMNLLLMEAIARQRHAGLLREAGTERLLNQLQAQRPTLSAPMLARMGGIFITIGQKLRDSNSGKQPGMLRDT